MKSKKSGFRLMNFLWLTVAGVVNAFGITFFLAPVKLFDSGISGTSMLLSQVTPLALSVFLVILNVPLFLYGLKRQGIYFTVYAIYSVLIYSVMAYVYQNFLPFDLSTSSPFAQNDIFLCAIFGGLISGLGSGLAIRNGGAMDGIEVMAVIFSKKLNMTVGTFVMAFNVVLYICAGIVTKSWVLPLYSIITYAAGLKTVDFIIEGLDRSKAASIITTKPQEVCSSLSKTFECGITTMQAQGFFSKQDKTLVYVIVNRYQIARLRTLVHECDPLAYISITDVADIFRGTGAKTATPEKDK
ncbi:MAG: YitT family protein [Treponemataceae bacterium]|nr:YitT family protein [Treponemataceae bacterium]